MVGAVFWNSLEQLRSSRALNANPLTSHKHHGDTRYEATQDHTSTCNPIPSLLKIDLLHNRYQRHVIAASPFDSV